MPYNGPKLVFLGTGDALNNQGRAHQSLWIEYNSHIFLIDFGPTTLYLLQNRWPNGKIPEMDAILFTHFHGDHFLGTLFLDLAFDRVLKRKREIIYAGPRNIEDHFKKTYDLSYPGLYPNPKSKFQRKFHEFHPFRSCDIFQDGSVMITPIPMEHGNIIALGYRIQMGNILVAISGDTQWNENIPKLCQGATLSILECKFNQKKFASDYHLSWEEIEANRSRLQTQALALVHVGSEALQTLPKDVLAFIRNDGDEIQL